MGACARSNRCKLRRNIQREIPLSSLRRSSWMVCRHLVEVVARCESLWLVRTTRREVSAARGPIVGANTPSVRLSRSNPREKVNIVSCPGESEALGTSISFRLCRSRSGTAERKAQGRIHGADASPTLERTTGRTRMVEGTKARRLPGGRFQNRRQSATPFA